MPANRKPSPLQTILTFTAVLVATALILLAVLIAWIAVSARLHTYHEQAVLKQEVSRLNLANSQLQVNGYDSVSVHCSNDFLSLGCPTQPEMSATYDFKQTTLGEEISTLKQKLSAGGYHVQYDAENSPEVISGTSKRFYVHIAPQYQHQAENSNSSTPVDGIYFRLQDTSVIDY
jgi:hypothetical protein